MIPLCTHKGADMSPYPDAFIASWLPSLSCTFLFMHSKVLYKPTMSPEELAVNILSPLLQDSSYRPSIQVVANYTFLM